MSLITLEISIIGGNQGQRGLQHIYLNRYIPRVTVTNCNLIEE